MTCQRQHPLTANPPHFNFLASAPLRPRAMREEGATAPRTTSSSSSTWDQRSHLAHEPRRLQREQGRGRGR